MVAARFAPACAGVQRLCARRRARALAGYGQGDWTPAFAGVELGFERRPYR